MVWTVTPYCNARCIFCDSWKHGKNEKQEKDTGLSFQEKVRVIKKMSDAGTWFLSFCGGEPLTCPDIEDLVRTAKACGMVVNISTNGLLLKEKAAALLDAGVDFITISLDSHVEEDHDSVRGLDGIYRNVQLGLDSLKALKKEVYIEVRCLVNRLNCLSLENIARSVKDRADRLSLKPIYENSVLGYRVPDSMKINPEEEQRIREHFDSFLKNHRYLDTAYNRLIPDFFFGTLNTKKTYRCLAGTFFAGLDHKGSVFPCHEMNALPNTPAGNLKDSDFMEIWRSVNLTDIRRKFKKGLVCDCWMDRFQLNIDIGRLLRPVEILFDTLSDK